MYTVILTLDPRRLENPDLDLRYELPDLLVEKSGGVIEDDGYDYASDATVLLLFLKTKHLAAALACIKEVVENVRVLGNDLRQAVTVAVSESGRAEVVYPPNSQDEFTQ